MTVVVEFLFVLIVSLIPKENQVNSQTDYILTDFSQQIKREAFLYTIMVYMICILVYTFMDQIKKERKAIRWTK